MFKYNKGVFTTITKKFDKLTSQEADSLIKNAAKIILSNTIKNTPVSESEAGHTGGLLRKSWNSSPLIRRGNGTYKYREITIYNNVHYAPHVEYGHRTRLGTGKKPSKNGGIAFVKGVFMLHRATGLGLKYIQSKK